MIMDFSTRNGCVTVESSSVHIKKFGVFGKKVVAEKSIPINQLVSVQIGKTIGYGSYILFQTATDKTGNTYKSSEMVNNENAIAFNSKAEETKAHEVKDCVEKLMEKKQNKAEQLKMPDPVDEIRRYKSLLDDEIITKDEFEAKKKQLLGL